MRLLESAGYCCTRAAASFGVFDIVAISATDILLVQVKSNRLPSAPEIEAIKLFVAPANCRKLVHVWHDRKRLPRVLEV